MSHRHWRIWGLVVGLLALPAQGRAGEEEALRQAGALLWEMSEIHHDFGNQHIARGMTPDKVQKMAGKAASRLAAQRNELAELWPRLDPASRLASDVGRFLEKWPDQQSFQADLMIYYDGGQSGQDITGLAMQVNDPRRKWRTLFPIFHP